MHLLDNRNGSSDRAPNPRERLLAENLRLKRTVTLQQNLAAMIVHDLRSPLACVGGYMDLLSRSSTCSRGDRELVRRAERCLQTLGDLVTSLLDVSRMQAGKMPLHLADVSLGSLVREAMSSHVTGPSGADRVRIVGPADGIVANCDPGVIRRVIANLVSNALKYSPEGSRVEVHVEPGADTVHVDVQDHGPGIPRRFQGRIFEKFSRLDVERAEQPDGTGLGLTFCKLAVEAHGGHLGLESEEGQGSRFWFELPTHGPHATAVG